MTANKWCGRSDGTCISFFGLGGGLIGTGKGILDLRMLGFAKQIPIDPCNR